MCKGLNQSVGSDLESPIMISDSEALFEERIGSVWVDKGPMDGRLAIETVDQTPAKL